MTLTAYRLTKAKHAATAFSGEGARLFGGRWNAVGTPVVYLADSLALAALETLVHLERPGVLEGFVFHEVSLDDALVLALADADLPDDWRASPEPAGTVAIGEAWVQSGASLALRVPSAVVPRAHNILLNPAHPDRGALHIEGPWAFAFDARLG